MNASSEMAEARATAIVLRATAKVVRAEQGALRLRLNRSADVLDGMVALAVRCLERIEQLEQELRQLRAGAPSGAGNAGMRPERASGDSPAPGPDPLNVAVRNLQLAHAVATVAERAATHDMAEVHCLADVFVVVVSLIERGLDALDESEGQP